MRAKGENMTAICSVLIAVAALIIAAPSFSAESIPYEFTTLDIAIPGQPDGRASPEDINNKGHILTNVSINNLVEALIARPTDKKVKTATFSCTGLPFADTYASSINDKGQIVGSCTDAPSGPRKQHGFIRNRDGSHILRRLPWCGRHRRFRQ